MYGRHAEVQNIKQGKKTLANVPRYRFGNSSIKGIVEISRFLEMKIESRAFKVYTSNRYAASDCFKAEKGKAFLTRNATQLTLSHAFLEVDQNT